MFDEIWKYWNDFPFEVALGDEKKRIFGIRTKDFFQNMQDMFWWIYGQNYVLYVGCKIYPMILQKIFLLLISNTMLRKGKQLLTWRIEFHRCNIDVTWDLFMHMKLIFIKDRWKIYFVIRWLSFSRKWSQSSSWFNIQPASNAFRQLLHELQCGITNQ